MCIFFGPQPACTDARVFSSFFFPLMVEASLLFEDLKSYETVQFPATIRSLPLSKAPGPFYSSFPINTPVEKVSAPSEDPSGGIDLGFSIGPGLSQFFFSSQAELTRRAEQILSLCLRRCVLDLVYIGLLSLLHQVFRPSRSVSPRASLLEDTQRTAGAPCCEWRHRSSLSISCTSLSLELAVCLPFFFLPFFPSAFCG